MLEISTEELRRCDVVRAKGRIDSETAPQLGEAFKTITESGRFKIVFNMSELGFVSSAGLREMIETMKTSKKFNRGNLVLAEVPPKMEEVLELAGLVKVFKLYETETQAVGDF